MDEKFPLRWERARGEGMSEGRKRKTRFLLML
jgi:hypothetical protein